MQPVLLPAQTAVPIETAPAPANASLVEAPKTKLPPVPVVRDEPNPKKAKKQRTKTLASATIPPAPSSPTAAGNAAAATAPKANDPISDPVPVAPVDPSKDIGVFTVGGDESPRSKQEAANLIAANDRRLTAMGGERSHVDPSLLSKVRNFQKEAEQALGSGDAEGAKTLATKGKLLLDDMDRGIPSQ